MTLEVKHVSAVVKDIVLIKKKAAEVSERLHMHMDAAGEALDMVNEMATVLGDATAELRAVLGMQTNSPPPGERLEDEVVGRDVGSA